MPLNLAGYLFINIFPAELRKINGIAKVVPGKVGEAGGIIWMTSVVHVHSQSPEELKEQREKVHREL